jgi:hypothetical protein
VPQLWRERAGNASRTGRDHQGRTVTEYAVRESDGSLIRDGSWECVSDVVGSFHGGFAKDGRVTGVLLSRENPADEWKEVA